MTKNSKAEQKRKPKLDNRVIAGGLVGVAILAIVLFKIAGSQASAVAVTPVPTNAVVLGPVAPTAAASSGEDAYPSTPAAQVQWVYRNNQPAMLLYHSTNCIPCKAMEALVAQVRADYEPDVVFVDIITNDANNSLEVRRSGIRYIPTTFFVSASGESEQVVGAMKEEDLRAKLESLKAGE